MKTIAKVFLIVLLPLFLVPTVAAADVRYDKVTVLGKDEVVNHDYFAGGDSVTVSGTVNGDAYVAGGNVLVDGTINGDLLVAGGMLRITGTVAHDIRAAGGNITISGPVGGSVTVGGGSVSIAESATIGGSIVAGVGSMEVYAPVTGGMMVGAGNLRIDNSVGGDVTTGVGQFSLSKNANIAGNVSYWSDQKVLIEGDATVAGQLTQHMPPARQPKPSRMQVAGALAGFATTFKIIEFIGALVLGSILIALAPISTQKTAVMISAKPWQSLLTGFIAIIVIPIAILILLITVIGIKIALAVLALTAVVSIFAKIFAALFAGMQILSALTKGENLYAALVVGLIVLSLLFFVPIVGWIAAGVLYLMGFGGIILEKKQLYATLRSRKLI